MVATPVSLTPPSSANKPRTKPGPPDSDFGFDDATPASSTIAPWPANKPRTKPAPPDSGFGFDDATPVCTPEGGPPVGDIKLDPQYARQIVTGALGAIPEVGGPLSMAAKLLWKDGTSDSLFNQMKDYVKQLVPEALTEEFERHLDRRVEGIENVLRNYNGEVDPKEKPGHLNKLYNDLSSFEPDFGLHRPDTVDAAHPPDRTIRHFVAFGALKMLVLKERLDRAAPEFRAARAKELYDEIKRYWEHAQKVKAAIIAARVAKVHPKNGSYLTPIDVTEFGNFINDEVKYSEAQDDACNWSAPGHDGHDNPDTLRDVANRKDAVLKTYNQMIDNMLEPLNTWRAVLPEEIARVKAERERAEADRKAQEWALEQARARAAAERQQTCPSCESLESRGRVPYD